MLENYTLDNVDDIAKGIADDFRERRIEKDMNREQVNARIWVRQERENDD